jgi:hypothetical protein
MTVQGRGEKERCQFFEDLRPEFDAFHQTAFPGGRLQSGLQQWD